MAGALLAAGTLTEAAMITGTDQAAITLFENLTSVGAKKSNGANPDTNPDKTLKWTLKSQSYFDEDEGIHVMEWTNEVTMPILSTDEITFHIEFTNEA